MLPRSELWIDRLRGCESTASLKLERPGESCHLRGYVFAEAFHGPIEAY
jgi:hypothetical protein